MKARLCAIHCATDHDGGLDPGYAADGAAWVYEIARREYEARGTERFIVRLPAGQATPGKLSPNQWQGMTDALRESWWQFQCPVEVWIMQGAGCRVSDWSVAAGRPTQEPPQTPLDWYNLGRMEEPWRGIASGLVLDNLAHETYWPSIAQRVQGGMPIMGEAWPWRRSWLSKMFPNMPGVDHYRWPHAGLRDLCEWVGWINVLDIVDGAHRWDGTGLHVIWSGHDAGGDRWLPATIAARAAQGFVIGYEANATASQREAMVEAGILEMTA